MKRACGLGNISTMMLNDRNDVQYVKLALLILQVELKAHVLLPLDENNKDLRLNLRLTYLRLNTYTHTLTLTYSRTHFWHLWEYYILCHSQIVWGKNCVSCEKKDVFWTFLKLVSGYFQNSGYDQLEINLQNPNCKKGCESKTRKNG